MKSGRTIEELRRGVWAFGVDVGPDPEVSRSVGLTAPYYQSPLYPLWPFVTIQGLKMTFFVPDQWVH